MMASRRLPRRTSAAAAESPTPARVGSGRSAVQQQPTVIVGSAMYQGLRHRDEALRVPGVGPTAAGRVR